MTTCLQQRLSTGSVPVDDTSLGVVLSLCDRSGVMVRPWVEAGFRAVIVDVQHDGVTTDGLLTRIGADVRTWTPPVDNYAAVFAFPPCTNLAASGARWFQEKGMGALIEALTLVEACRRICEALTTCWMLENPHGTLSTYWRKPDYTFDPCDFGGYLDGGGDRYTKRTNLWCGTGFTMPAVRRVEPVEGSKMHFVSPGPDRANLRSLTPEGFARAVFEANRHGPAEDLLSPLRSDTRWDCKIGWHTTSLGFGRMVDSPHCWKHRYDVPSIDVDHCPQGRRTAADRLLTPVDNA